jgi:hypothetical protein
MAQIEAFKAFLPRNVKQLLERFAPVEKNHGSSSGKESTGDMLAESHRNLMVQSVEKEEESSQKVVQSEKEKFESVIGEFFEALGSDFEDCQTAFGYFHDSEEATNPLEMNHAMLFRGAARYLKREHKGADLLLPLVLKDGRHGLILVQIKGIDEDVLDESKRGNILKYFRHCNIPGVFNYNIDDKRLKDETKKRRIAEYTKYSDFPTIKILINLRNISSGNYGGRVFYLEPEKSSPVLLIQSDGALEFLPSEVRKFVISAVRLATDSSQGKMGRLEAYRSNPPINLENTSSFNPVYRHLANDCDNDLFYGEKSKLPMFTPEMSAQEVEIIRSVIENDRPYFKNIN